MTNKTSLSRIMNDDYVFVPNEIVYQHVASLMGYDKSSKIGVSQADSSDGSTESAKRFGFFRRVGSKTKNLAKGAFRMIRGGKKEIESDSIDQAYIQALEITPKQNLLYSNRKKESNADKMKAAGWVEN